MISDLKLSFERVINERLESPFYGAFVISWLLWNWKIPYVTLFVSSEKLNIDKVQYIVGLNHTSQTLFWYPLFSSVILVLVMPLVTNGVYYVNLKYTAWRRRKKNDIEKARLLTFEESNQLREQMLLHEEKFLRSIENKDKEIDSLKAEIIDLREKLAPLPTVPEPILSGVSSPDTNFSSDEEIKLLSNRIFTNNVLAIDKYIQNSWTFSGSSIPSEAVSFFVANELIEPVQGGRFALTSKGKRLLRRFFDSKP